MRRLDTQDSGFAAAFAAVLAEKREVAADVSTTVARILEDVRRRGDQAVIDYTAQFDRLTLTADTLRVPAAEIAAAAASIPAEQAAALGLAADRIRAYHASQRPRDERYRDAAGVELGVRWTPVTAVGVYVPGGLAAYPSTVLMNTIPAVVAGVGRIAMAVPAPDGRLHPLVLAAAKLAGVDEIYRIGGAQAVAAFAYGTAAIAAVDKVVGPGNAYVAAAKRQLFGIVGIDSIAGPSEILVVADRDNDPLWIAADLLAQVEHGSGAQAILIADDRAFADAVAAGVEHHLARLSRSTVTREGWERYGTIIVVRSLDEAPALVDRIAPEHLEVAVAEAEAFAARVHHAGAIFLGRHTPEAIGDYVAGPNHVLPTARTARFSSGLSVLDFVKRTSIVACDPASLGRIGPAAVTLAEAEGLPAHALSVALRLQGTGR
ncbi:MAG: histidinol dehydrogenase [Alphaproteobacteria bacterium]|nr:histidinol dehydrogenase [Alphaproteobacteria bacterium]